MTDDPRFSRIRALAFDLAGIELGDSHRELIARRCDRFAGGGVDIEALLDAVERGEAEAIERLIGLLTTRHTSFFRNPR
ncbi:MAG: hypothetical protein FJX37_07070 [Alphaproteobacteria bacterium]|nr:hypothetical protein [Alphaproteobacteria bacterium]MBM3733194.1 hypothetical protein [Acidimicrobiia bacterium]